MATTRSPFVQTAQVTPADGVQELFRAHGDAVYRLAVLMLGRPHAAEDVVQDTFLKALAHLSGGKPLDNPRGWLCTVAAHACRDRQRAARRWIPWLPERDVRVAPDRADARVDADAVLAAVQDLLPRDRAVIALRAEGFSHAEIAAALGIKPVSIGRLVARALERLARRLPIEDRR